MNINISPIVKKVISSSVAFMVATIVALMVFMPYNKIASKYIDDLIKSRKLDLVYESLDIGLFGASVKNIRTGPIKVSSVNASYNPIGLIFKRVKFNADSPLFNLNGSLKGDNLNAEIKGSLAGIGKLIGYDASGSFNSNVNYNIVGGTGDLDISSGALSFKHPLMTIETDSLNASANLKGNLLTIDNVSATGKTTLAGSGTINLNTKKIEQSNLDIAGKAGIMGMSMDFKLTGPITAPRFVTR